MSVDHWQDASFRIVVLGANDEDYLREEQLCESPLRTV